MNIFVAKKNQAEIFKYQNSTITGIILSKIFHRFRVPLQKDNLMVLNIFTYQIQSI